MCVPKEPGMPIIKIGPDNQKHFGWISDDMVAELNRVGNVTCEAEGEAAYATLLAAITATQGKVAGELKFQFRWTPTMPIETWGIHVFIMLKRGNQG